VTKTGDIRDDTPVPEGLDRNVMKMIQNLHLDADFSIERISDIMEVEESTVRKVLAIKKVMPLAFNELNYFLVGSCNDDVVAVDIIATPPNDGKSKDPKGAIASLEMPVKDVIRATDHVIHNRSFSRRPQRKMKTLKDTKCY